MGKLSEEEINKIEEICSKINSTAISPIDKAILYKRLEEIYKKNFIELPSKDTNVKGL